MRKAFTLLEMIFVLSVISLIFVLTIPNIQKVLSIAQAKACDAQLKVVDSAILEYRLLTGEGASSVNDLIEEDLLTEKQTECSNHESIEISEGQAYAQS